MGSMAKISMENKIIGDNILYPIDGEKRVDIKRVLQRIVLNQSHKSYPKNIVATLDGLLLEP